MQWEVVIGLEIHTQLTTRSKIFSNATSTERCVEADPEDATPNRLRQRPGDVESVEREDRAGRPSSTLRASAR